MNGKRSPTAKLESQLTVPAMVKAAGRCDCWNNSPVRMKGMPPAVEGRAELVTQGPHCALASFPVSWYGTVPW